MVKETFELSSYLLPQQFYLRHILRVQKNTVQEIEARSTCAFRMYLFQLTSALISLVISYVAYVDNEDKYNNKVFMQYYATGHVYSQVDDDQHIYDGVMYSQYAKGQYASQNRYNPCNYHTSIFNLSNVENILRQSSKNNTKYAPYYLNATKTLDSKCGVDLKSLFFSMQPICEVVEGNKLGLLGVTISLFLVLLLAGIAAYLVSSLGCGYSVKSNLMVAGSANESYETRQNAYNCAFFVLNSRGRFIHGTQIFLGSLAIFFCTEFITNIDDLRNQIGDVTSDDRSCDVIKDYNQFLAKLTTDFIVVQALNIIGIILATISFLGVFYCRRAPKLVIHDNEEDSSNVVLHEIYDSIPVVEGKIVRSIV